MNIKNRVVIIIDIIEVLMLLTIFILFYISKPINYKKNVIYIPKGSLNYTIKYLNNRGLNLSIIDKVFIYFIGSPQKGWIDLKYRNLTHLDFIYAITHNKAKLARITIIPGETTYFVYRQIERKLLLNNINCNFEEGFLKPDTYFLPISMSQNSVCNYLKNISLAYHKKINQKIFGKFDYQKYMKYLIIASLIQKEAANKYEMRLISSVIKNRLDKHMKLQLDGSLNYGRFSHTIVTSKRIRSDKSRYNTYKYKGLPPTPVAIPSKEAIIAAIFPAKTDYLFFYKCKEGHLFTSSYKDHLRNIKNCK